MPGMPRSAAYPRSNCQTTFSPKAFTGNGARAVHRAEHVAVDHTGCNGPSVDRNFHPCRHGRGTNPSVLANEIDDTPASIALLDVRESECRHLRSAQAAPEKNG